MEEHAELHFALYLEHGLLEDWCAAYGLCGSIGKAEMSSFFATRWWENNHEEHSRKIREGKQTPEARERTSKSMVELYKDESERKKRSDKLKAYYATPEGKEKKRLAHLKRSETMAKRRAKKPRKLTRSEAQRARRARERGAD